ncbi:hypothetical protein HMPREF1421_01525 [Helicobacter pylori GAM265BSii]|uniref:Uncharacterized protein n=1 Tax=Helicobacter pylori GAM265BSii TaxID=1159049 RepID=M3R375_HELPX|nr:hypothetical protein HMPREF1421_01525 [Helicobacter pylori GAM265BSii]
MVTFKGSITPSLLLLGGGNLCLVCILFFFVVIMIAHVDFSFLGSFLR